MRTHPSRTLSFAPLSSTIARAVSLRFDFQVSDQEQINDVDGLVGLADIDRATAWQCHREFAMQHWNLAPICQVHYKRLERLGIVKAFELFNRHRFNPEN